YCTATYDGGWAQILAGVLDPRFRGIGAKNVTFQKLRGRRSAPTSRVATKVIGNRMSADSSTGGILIGFVGDVLIDRDDPHEAFAEVRQLLREPDILFGNLESPYSDAPQ